jgi:hypothetical protein
LCKLEPFLHLINYLTIRKLGALKTATALKENQASIRVMEKVGMQFEKFARYEAGSIDAVWYKTDRLNH